MKNINKKHLFISLAIILSPSILTAVLWNKLGNLFRLIWSDAIDAAGLSSPLIQLLAIPLFLTFTHLFCLFFTARDQSRTEQHPKVVTMIYYLVPLVSVFVNGLLFATIFGLDLYAFSFLLSLPIGTLFILFGNYMPKCKMNRVVGIRSAFTTSSETNWTMTHRLAGKVFVVAGIIIFLTALLPAKLYMFFLLPVLLLSPLVPYIYSICRYRKELAEGKITQQTNTQSKLSKNVIRAVIVSLVLVLVVILLFTGEITYTISEQTLDIKAPLYHTSVQIAAIESIEFSKTSLPASRINGIASAKLTVGYFRNQELGSHTRYVYVQTEAAIILTVEDTKVVLNAETYEETVSLYESILAMMNAAS